MGPQEHASLMGEALPLSLSQREVWLDQRAWPDSTHLNIGGGAFLVGPLDVDCFRRALQILVAENVALRLAPLDNGTQMLLPVVEPAFEVIDIGDVNDPHEAMRAWWKARIRAPFPMDGTPPWRFALLRGNDKLHGLTIQFHHLIMDGWGTSQVMRRWSEIYNALASKQEPGSSPAADYREFIQESLAYQASDAFDADAAFWMAQIPALPPPLFDRPHAAAERRLPAAEMTTRTVPRSDYNQMGQFAAHLGVSTFVFYLSALALHLARVSGQREVTIGVPSINRRGQRYKKSFGMFVGVFALKVSVDPQTTIRELIATVHAAMRKALRHPRYPLSELGRSLQVLQHKRDGPFDVILSFERQDYAVAFGAAELVDSRQLFAGTARYPLGVTVCEFHPDQDVELVLEGSSACFSAHELDLFGYRLCSLMARMMHAPDMLVEDVDLLPAEERWALIEGQHEDVARQTTTHPFVCLFEHQAALSPDAIALVWDGGSMDYGTLNGRANHLARRLITQGAGRERIVAVAVRRSADMVIALLAVAKAGAAFLPLDTDTPLSRLAGILEASGAVMLLTDSQNMEKLEQLHAKVVVVGGEASSPVGPSTLPAPGDLAYVLFTSGSTGKPKGVMVEHAALSRRLGWLSRTYAVQRQDRSAQATQLTFDPALIELMLPLVSGASVALPPPGRLLPESLAAFAVSHAVTIMAFVPVTLNRFLEGASQQSGLRLRVACCGGEVLAPELSNRFLLETGARLYNVYGPTETTIFATAWECRVQSADAPLPVGRPVDDTRIYVLDERLRPVPYGAVGEIYIGGDAVARGYLNPPDTGLSPFVDDPYRSGHRMYRTGDRGMLRSDGNLYFIGRVDRQVKLRGYRIELGEIEASLLSAKGVQQAAAKLIDQDGKKNIHAWVAGRPEQDAENLKRLLRTRLPDYMLPASIDILPALPSSTSGKIDYNALPEPVPLQQAMARREPRNELERDLLSIWETVLRRKIGVRDNFFDLGGDSLAAIQILARIERLRGDTASLHLLIEHPTVEQLATALEGHSASHKLLVQLGEDRGRVPVFLAASGHGDLLRFQNLARALEDVCDLHMLQPPEAGGIAIDALAELYADRVEARSSSACYLAGFSVGGIAALETSRLLQERGNRVRGLFLIDTIYPGSLLGRAMPWRTVGWLTRNLRLQELSMNGRKLGAMFSDAGLVAQINALRRYRPGEFSGPTHLIKSSGLAHWDRWLFRSWRGLMPTNLSELQVPGLHGSMFEPANVQNLAAAIASRLESAEGKPAPRP